MTDVATRNESDETSEPSAATPADVQWAPVDPARRRKHLGLWIGIPSGLLVAGAVAASLMLIAPGAAVAGVPVGFLTQGAATDAIASRLAGLQITLGTDGPTVSAADLGATVDAAALAADAFADRPLWNLTQWYGDSSPAEIDLDATTATAALRAALPSLYTDPVPAGVAFTGKAYEVTPAVAGAGIDVAAVRAAVQSAFDAGETAVTIEPTLAPVQAAATTELAQGTADQLNGMLEKVGFYVGDERTVPVSAKTAAGWLTVTSDASGAFAITADTAAIQKVVDTLQKKVDQDAVTESVITNAEGDVLETKTEGQDGRVLGDTGGIAAAFAAQLAAGDAVYPLPVTVTAHETKEVAYLLEVDLSAQRLYVKENGATVMTWPISSGVDLSPTYQGHYTVNSHITSQTMRASDPDNPYWNYDVPNVKWVMYFNGNQAFHGVYWHDNFGNRMSHGCVGMPDWRAKLIYDWAPTGTDVWIHG